MTGLLFSITGHFENPFTSPNKCSPVYQKGFCRSSDIAVKDDRISVPSKENATCTLRERADCTAGRLEASSPRSVDCVDFAEEYVLRPTSSIRDEHVFHDRFSMRSQQLTFSNPSEPIVDIPSRNGELPHFILAGLFLELMLTESC